jgi:hypothetical protein
MIFCKTFFGNLEMGCEDEVYVVCVITVWFYQAIVYSTVAFRQRFLAKSEEES